MAVIQSLTATILIQVGADKPKPIGTIEIPIELGVGKRPGLNYPPGVRSGINSGHPDDDRIGLAKPAPHRPGTVNTDRSNP